MWLWRRRERTRHIPSATVTSVDPLVDPRRWAVPPPSGISRFVPIVRWLPARPPVSAVRCDGGCDGVGLLVPESIAYAGLAGLSAQAGLYTLLVTLVLFCGGLFLLAGLLRLGFVAQFLSGPVMEGFVSWLPCS